MPLIYKPYQATLANKEGQKLFYPRLVKIGRTVNTENGGIDCRKGFVDGGRRAQRDSESDVRDARTVAQ